MQQLLDISKIENGSLQYNMQHLALNDFITDQMSVMHHILPDHQLTLSLAENVTVNVDKLRMEQVFSNILGNAAKYSPKQSTISVGTRCNDDQTITLSVTDKGRGMAAETIKSVFNKFYRSTDVMKTHTGLGMGLFVASKIISDHGGKIWAESSEGDGSLTFLQ